jgi:hypothetical protein
LIIYWGRFGERRRRRRRKRCKICLARELNPGLQRERREHWPLYQGGLIRIYRNISLQILCSSIFSILSPEDGAYGLTLYSSNLSHGDPCLVGIGLNTDEEGQIFCHSKKSRVLKKKLAHNMYSRCNFYANMKASFGSIDSRMFAFF